MLAQELINPLIPPLRTTDSVQKALNWMSQFRVHQLPVVEHQQYKGLIGEEVLYDLNTPDAQIGDILPDFEDVFVFESQHFYDVLKAAEAYHLPLVAVLDEEHKFKGVITIKDTIAAFARSFSTQHTGGILVISMREYDYSLAQITRLIEENHVKVLSSYLEADSYDPTMVKLTLKLDKTDLTRTVATLERFGFNIIAKFQDSEAPDYDKDRLDMLFKYLSF